jgi:putative ABC transport system permease protein
MCWLRSIWRNLFRKHAVNSALEEEIRSYGQLLEDEKIATGADSESARREAAIELGGIEMIKEQVRDIRRGVLLEGLWTELRQSIRALRQNFGMAAMCAFMLALGLGASTTIFGVFEAALLRPLPFRDPGRLGELVETRLDRGMSEVAFSEADFWDLHDRAKSFERVAAYHTNQANLTGDGQPERLSAPQVTVEFFRALGVSPVLGRDFSAQEGRANVAILGNKFWKTRYWGNAHVLGKVLRLNDTSYTVVGVLPAGEPWIDDQVYLPYPYHPSADRSSWEFNAVGRLAKGVTAEAAKKELQSLSRVLAAANPKDDKGLGFNFFPSSRWIAPESTHTALRLLLAAVGLLVLIACVNVTSLLLARGLARQREIAVRTALGAGRARLIRFVMLESLLLSALGAALGLALAAASLRILRNLEIHGVPRLDEVSFNPWVIAFTLAATLLTGLLCGLAPALQTPAQGISATLREGDRQAGGSRRQGRLRSMLVTAEVALAFILLVGTGLVVRSFQGLLSEHRGFHTARRLMFSLSYPDSYGENGVDKQFVDRFLEKLSADPDIVASGAVNVRPVEGPNFGMGIDASTRPAGSESPPWAGWRIVTPGYFRAVGLPLLHGRNFNETDKPVWAERGQPPPAHRTVMLSSALAKLLFPNENPIGKHTLLWKGQGGGLDAEVVGVAGDSLERGLDHGPALTVYLPYGRVGLPSEFVLETRGDPMAVVASVRAIIARLDPNLPLADIRTFDDVVNRSVSSQRMNSVVLVTFSGLALLLASLGIYGVLSYSVSRRTSEIGLRMALGASQSGILKMTVGQGLLWTVVGIAIGVPVAYWLSRYLKALLFGVRSFDLFTYAAVSALLLLMAALACFLPGRRAMRTDPAIALRLE